MNHPIRIALALVWKQDRLLIAKRVKGAHLGGFWEFPGGRIEPSESPESAAVREVAEELGVQCVSVTQRANFSFEYPERRLQFFPVDCVWEFGEPSALGALSPRWVSQREIGDYNFPPANRELLRELQEHWGMPG